MNTFLTAWWSRGATAVFALVAIGATARLARADYLVRTYANSAPASVRSPLLQAEVPPQYACREPLTVNQPHEDAEPLTPEIDEEELAAALQALLVCAIPPPVDTIVQTPTTPPATTTTTVTTTTQQPNVPSAPEYILPVYPDTSGGGGNVHIADAPEPASLLTALIGSSLAGIVMWQKRGKKRRRLVAA